jgi:hypothetical protein
MFLAQSARDMSGTNVFSAVSLSRATMKRRIDISSDLLNSETKQAFV